MDQVQSAIEMAVKFHAGQYRKEHSAGGYKIPFIVHPMQVAKMVFDFGAGNPINLAAAFCHDILEDTAIPPSLLLEAIGHDAYVIVNELTFFAQQRNDPTAKAEEKNAYLKTFTTKSIDALVIKVADRFCNVHDFISSGDAAYGAKYSNKAQPLYDAALGRMGEITLRFGSGTAINVKNAVDRLVAIASG